MAHFTYENFFNTPEIKRIISPTRIFIGGNARDLLFDFLPADIKNCVVLVIDRFFEKNIFVEKIKKDYRKHYEIIVGEEPDSNFIKRQLKLITEKISCIIAIGGGSTIDTAKALKAHRLYGEFMGIGYGEYRNLPEIERNEIKLIALPTTAGSGSEVSRYYLVINSDTKEKTANRSWSLCPTYAFIDPYFLSDIKPRQLILNAFDAFVHSWETFICATERSPMNDILAMDSIGRIVGSLGKFVKTKVIDEEILKNLQYGATLGGLALSNVRTGLLHDAGESLSSQISISHPETMVIFFNESLILYGKAIKERLEILSQTMERYYENNGFDRVENIMIFWDKLFEEFSIKEDIGNRLKDIFIDRNLISEKIMKDSVLVNKESPIILTRDIVDKFIVKSLDF